MVTKISFYRRDPNGLNRGPGYYYLRGGKYSGVAHCGQLTYRYGKDYKTSVDGKAYFSKYNKETDRNRVSKGYKVNKIGIPQKIANKFAHISDGNLTKKINR